MNPMTPEAFDAAVSTMRLSEAVQSAVRSHMVDGKPVLEACYQYRISTAGFYRAANAIQPRKDADTPTTRVVFYVPDDHVDQLRERVAKQLAIWAAQAAERKAIEDGVGIDD